MLINGFIKRRSAEYWSRELIASRVGGVLSTALSRLMGLGPWWSHPHPMQRKMVSNMASTKYLIVQKS